MSTIQNDHVSLYWHINKIIKEPETSCQTPALSQKQIRNFCYKAH